MTFLELCKRLRSECSISGSGPTTVIGQTGEMERVVNWVNDAWMDIQAQHPDWEWLRKSFSFTTTDGKSTYTPTECGVTDLGEWKIDSMRYYPTTVGTRGEIHLTKMNYDAWRDLYQFNAYRSVKTRPINVTVCPDLSLGLGPSPNDVGYTVVGDYYRLPQLLVNDADVPAMPEKHQMVIVYRAMMYYASYTAAAEVYQRGEMEYRKFMRRMRTDRLPPLRAAGALA